MATSAVSIARVPQFRLKYLLFGFVGLMMLYVLQHNERFLIQPDHPIWGHYESFKWFLLAHGLAGGTALLLGPTQFSDRLRQRYTKAHRVMGRFYIAGVFIAAPMGVYIQHLDEKLGFTRTFTYATAVDATAWITTTAIALALILAGKTQQHRQWMVRSYAVATVFLQVRVVSGIFNLDEDFKAAEALVWGCVGVSLLAADVILQVEESLRARQVKLAQERAMAARQNV